MSTWEFTLYSQGKFANIFPNSWIMTKTNVRSNFHHLQLGITTVEPTSNLKVCHTNDEYYI